MPAAAVIRLATTADHDFWDRRIAASSTPLDVARLLHRDDVVQLLNEAAGGAKMICCLKTSMTGQKKRRTYRGIVARANMQYLFVFAN